MKSKIKTVLSAIKAATLGVLTGLGIMLLWGIGVLIAVFLMEHMWDFIYQVGGLLNK